MNSLGYNLYILNAYLIEKSVLVVGDVLFSLAKENKK